MTHALEEANAAIGAAISTCSLATEVETALIEVQHELLDLAEALDRGEPVGEPDRIRLALQRYRVAELPRGFEVLGGTSDAAGLLKLARAVTRRAARSVPDGAEYLEPLAELLLAVAFRTEEEERRRVPYGLCIQP